MISIDLKTPNEINLGIAARFSAIRKRRKISRKELAKKSGVSYASLRRFEETGEISLISLSKLAIALNLGEELDSLFSDVPFNSIEEVINGQGK